MKKSILVSIIAVVVIIIVGVGIYFAINNANNNAEGLKDKGAQTQVPPVNTENNTENTNPIASTTENNPTEEIPTTAPDNKPETVIGKSVQGRDIIAYHYGSGTKEILLVGGIHGGYSWNTSLLAYQLMNYLEANPSTIPANIKVTVIPALNPDGLSKVVSVTGPFKSSDVSSSQTEMVAGRFNANTVDLNRNFDCDWKASGVWQSKAVSGGTAAFSEPESAAIRGYAQNKLTAVVAWYSSGGGVYASSCGGILPETQTITDLYAKAAGYTAYKNFASYQVSGDMTDWFSKTGVPAIGVLLTTANSSELDKNTAGIKALLQHYAE